ncbi:MAG: aldehyde dehydrogenase family protein [Bdellovibrionales bacterium]
MNLEERRQALIKLRQLLEKHSIDIQKDLKLDFGKPPFESEMTEVLSVIHEIDFFVPRLKKLISPRKVKTNWMNWPARSYILAEPYGQVLVLGAWNYPINLCLVPAVGALAAGNSVVLKPSELASHSSELLAQMINNNFHPDVLRVETGGVEVSQKLLTKKWDKIFFTGSTRVGKLIYQAAAEQMTPVLLELGGKSPAIFDTSCDWGISIKRLVWAKFFNAGQTCIAPDFVWVPKGNTQKFIELAKKEILASDYQIENENYTQIINHQHWDRLVKLMNSGEIAYGGNSNRDLRFISPTLITKVDWKDLIMQEEIFGPLLPVLEYENLDQVTAQLKKFDKPLALYLFAQSSEKFKWMEKWSFGGGAINEAVMQFSNPHLPFGGVGASGLGAYHGEESFWCFSHRKSLLAKPTWFEPPFKYGRLKEWHKSLIKWMMKLG